MILGLVTLGRHMSSYTWVEQQGMVLSCVAVHPQHRPCRLSGEPDPVLPPACGSPAEPPELRQG